MNSGSVESAESVVDSGSSSTARFFRETGLAAEIARIGEPVLEGLGFRLVRVVIGGQEGQTVQVMAERPDGTMTIEDCETVSRDLSAVLDTFDPMPGAYRLEVSSPGIDRPLVRPSDFEDWQGFEARVELKEPVSGRKRWRGELEGLVDGEVRMICEIEGLGRQVVGFPLSLVSEAKLLLTDALVREALREAKRGPTAGGIGPVDIDDAASSAKSGRRRSKREVKPARGRKAGTAQDVNEG